MFISHQTNHDITYIFQVVENFLHLFGNLYESCAYICNIGERPYILFQTNMGSS
jgi:hypothetical protein